jgi:hypothetical protein
LALTEEVSVTLIARYAYVLLAVVFAFGVVVQVMLAGMGLFVDVLPRGGPSFATHVDLGWALHMAPILIVVAALLSRAGRRHWIWALALAVVVFVVPLVVMLRASMPILAATHPLLAVLAFGMAIMVVRNSILALRLPPDVGATRTAE